MARIDGQQSRHRHKKEKRKKKQRADGVHDLIDMELGAPRVRILHPMDRFSADIDETRQVRIRIYRAFSSFTIYGMVICVLYFSSITMNSTYDMIQQNKRADKQKDQQVGQNSILRKIQSNNTREEDILGSLPFDTFLERVEEQIRSGKSRKNDHESNNATFFKFLNNTDSSTIIGRKNIVKDHKENEEQNEMSSRQPKVAVGKDALGPIPILISTHPRVMEENGKASNSHSGHDHNSTEKESQPTILMPSWGNPYVDSSILGQPLPFPMAFPQFPLVAPYGMNVFQPPNNVQLPVGWLSVPQQNAFGGGQFQQFGPGGIDQPLVRQPYRPS